MKWHNDSVTLSRFRTRTEFDRLMYGYLYRGIIPHGYEDLDWEELEVLYHHQSTSLLFAILELVDAMRAAK